MAYEELKAKMNHISSRSLGFCRRGESVTQRPVTAQIPDSLDEEKISFCGVKGFMIDEVREFTKNGEEPVTIACASAAALEITNSPIHVHSQTTETYTIIEGVGRMVLGNDIVDVKKGSVIVIPPGNEHGLMSSSESPIKVLMTFSPGLAPMEHEAYRDEAALNITTEERIKQHTQTNN